MAKFLAPGAARGFVSPGAAVAAMARGPILLGLAAFAIAGCSLRHAVLGLPEPVVTVAPKGEPVELDYRESKGGIVLVTERVNGKADAEGLDSSKARPLDVRWVIHE